MSQVHRIPSLLLPAALLAGLAACVEDPDAPALGEDEQAIVGGAVTNARPEIGVFYHGNGGGACTATLVSPRAILAAAHCLSPAYTGTTLHANAVFQFTDAGGTLRTHGVDRAHSFTNKRYEYLPGGVFTTDVVLLHLTAAVPTSQATPAALAVQEPTTGAQSTIFGYGCTSRTAPNGLQPKASITFNYGNTTTALCWGDSGGPVVYGATTGGGAIWGINSDFGAASSAEAWPDIFGGVPAYGKQIEDLLRRWDGEGEDNVNRPGMDYAVVTATSASACRASCQVDGNCRAYTFVQAANQCWLKGAVPEPVPYAPGGVTSGIPSKYELATNRAGSDYSAFWLDEPRAELCAAACGRDGQCQAYTYKLVSGYGACYLKNAVPAATTCANCTSGVMRRGQELHANRAGYDYASSYQTSPAACAQTCASDERCEAYTHTSTTGAGTCWLKDGVAPLSGYSGVVSGVRRGLEVGIDRPGRDYRGFYTSRLHATTCQAACARESQCQAWTYVPAAAGATSAICWLKSGIPAAQASAGTGIVSGVKGLELLP